MVFRNQGQAKQFFIDKILFQAQKDRIALSEAEKYMLDWTETEGGFELNQKLIDKFHEQTSSDDYELKVSSLIRSAYNSDIHNDPALGQEYHAAYHRLKQGDHYLLVMIEQAFQGLNATIKSETGLKDKLLLILASLGVTLVPFIAAVYFDFSKQWASFMYTCIFLYLFPFGLYCYAVHRTAKAKGSSLSTVKLVLFQFAIAAIAISTYVYLIVQFNVVDIADHESDRVGFRLIVSAPLLIISIILSDVTLQRGIFYDGIMEFLGKLNKKN